MNLEQCAATSEIDANITHLVHSGRSLRSLYVIC